MISLVHVQLVEWKKSTLHLYLTYMNPILKGNKRMRQAFTISYCIYFLVQEISKIAIIAKLNFPMQINTNLKLGCLSSSMINLNYAERIWGLIIWDLYVISMQNLRINNLRFICYINVERRVFLDIIYMLMWIYICKYICQLTFYALTV